MRGLRAVARLSLIAALAIAGGAVALSNRAAAHGPPTCTALGPQLLGGDIKYADAQIVPANTSPSALPGAFTGTAPSTAKVPVAYCLVVLSYSSTPPHDPTPQNITIYVGLPLNSVDGGVTGSTVDPPLNFTTVEGAWNGRTEGQGGGGCTGNTNVNSTGAVTNGFVGSGTDGGHGNPNNDPTNSCQQGVLSLGHLNRQYIEDWVYNGPQQEILWSKKVASLYYGARPHYNYWNGCSTGGHQGMALAQSLPDELDGILASAPAMYWTRFQTAQMWGQIAMYDIAQEVISGPKFAAVQNAAIAACDKNDGVADGIIDDPRTCTFNANANICGSTPTATCLTPKEADRRQRHLGRPAQRFRQEDLVPARSRHRLQFLGWKRAVLARSGAVRMGSGRSGLLQRRSLPDLLPRPLGKRRADFEDLGSRRSDNLRGGRAGRVEHGRRSYRYVRRP